MPLAYAPSLSVFRTSTERRMVSLYQHNFESDSCSFHCDTELAILLRLYTDFSTYREVMEAPIEPCLKEYILYYTAAAEI